MLHVHLGMRIDDPQNELKYLYEGKILGNKKIRYGHQTIYTNTHFLHRL